jgi:catechol-2,3-dioxygenase
VKAPGDRSRHARLRSTSPGRRERGIDVRLADHGVADSLYFSDPDGHRLELTTYEI